jgi:hypothetical protein
MNAAMGPGAPRPQGAARSRRSGGGTAQRPLAPETPTDFPRPPLRTRLSSQGWGWNWGWQGTTAAAAPRRAALDNHAPIGVPAFTAVSAAPPLGQGAGADADLPRHRALAAAALGILLGLAILAACAGLGLWLAAALFNSGALA